MGIFPQLTAYYCYPKIQLGFDFQREAPIKGIGTRTAEERAPLMSLYRKALLAIAASMMLVGTLEAADAPKPSKPDIATKAASPDLQKLIDQFSTQRDALLADRAALLEQLKNATAEQKKALLEKAEAQQKELIEAQRALGKRIRDEMRKVRENRPGPTR